jgi:branched-chain amino acid transport system permease protein
MLTNGIQIILNGLITGATYAVIAVGFSLVYKVYKFFFVAHGAIVAAGAFTFYSFYQLLRWNPTVAILGALFVSVTLSSIIEVGVHRPLRKRKATSLLLFLASSTVFILIQNILLFFFGPSVRAYKFELQTGMTVAGAIITPTQLLIISSSVLTFVVLHLVLNKTKIGKSMRAVSDDSLGASVVGIDPERTYLLTVNLSAVLACIAGILISLEQDLRFDIGLYAMLAGIVASVIGGVGNVTASIIGGLMVGIIENISVWFVPTGYKRVITFVILIAFLLIRPQGLLGHSIKEDYVKE